MRTFFPYTLPGQCHLGDATTSTDVFEGIFVWKPSDIPSINKVDDPDSRIVRGGIYVYLVMVVGKVKILVCLHLYSAILFLLKF